MGSSERSVIVVGVDGSPASAAALAFALREGAMRNSVIEVVTAWEPLPAWGAGHTGLPVMAAKETGEFSAQALQDIAVAKVLEGLPIFPVLSRRVIQGDAAEVLVRTASIADYLVVGTGRKGTLRRALLGSVSEFCVRRARCPVVVVPDPSVEAILESAS